MNEMVLLNFFEWDPKLQMAETSLSLVLHSKLDYFRYQLSFQTLNKCVSIQLKNCDTFEIYKAEIQAPNTAFASWCFTALSFNVNGFSQKSSKPINQSDKFDFHNQWVTEIKYIETRPTLVYSRIDTTVIESSNLTIIFSIPLKLSSNSLPVSSQLKESIRLNSIRMDKLESSIGRSSQTLSTSDEAFQPSPTPSGFTYHGSSISSESSFNDPNISVSPNNSLVFTPPNQIILTLIQTAHLPHSCRFIQYLTSKTMCSVIRDPKYNAQCLILDSLTLKTLDSFSIGTNFSLNTIFLNKNLQKLIISDYSQSYLSIYDPLQKALVICEKVAEKNELLSIAFNQTHIVIGLTKGRIRFLDYKLNLIESFQCTSHPIFSLAFDPKNSKLLYLGDTSGILYCFSLDKKSIIWESSIHSSVILHINPCNTFLFTCSMDRTIRQFDLSTRKVVHSFTGFINDTLRSIVYKNYLIGSSWDKTIRIYDMESKNLVQILKHQKSVKHISISNGCLYSASHDNTFKVWKFNDLNESH